MQQAHDAEIHAPQPNAPQKQAQQASYAQGAQSMKTREKIGYVLTLGALCGLIVGFVGYALCVYAGRLAQQLWFLTLTAAPLLLCLPRAVSRVRKTYAALALIAPWIFLVGGVIGLWQSWIWAAGFCLGAVSLEVGAILHNYQKRKKKKRPDASDSLDAANAP